MSSGKTAAVLAGITLFALLACAPSDCGLSLFNTNDDRADEQSDDRGDEPNPEQSDDRGDDPNPKQSDDRGDEPNPEQSDDRGDESGDVPTDAELASKSDEVVSRYFELIFISALDEECANALDSFTEKWPEVQLPSDEVNTDNRQKMARLQAMSRDLDAVEAEGCS